MCQISLTFEYSRMKVPSLRRGCEIAPLFVRYMDEHRSIRFLLDVRIHTVRCAIYKADIAHRPTNRLGVSRWCAISFLWFYAPQTKILEGGTKDEIRIFDWLKVTIQWFVAQIEYSRPWKVLPSKSGFHLLFLLYAPQTKILEDRTKDRACIFDAIFKGVSTRFGRRCLENLPLPNEDFGRPDELFVDLSACVFEALFKGVSTWFGLRNVEKCFENACWKVYKMFVRPSKIFVWGAYPSKIFVWGA